MSELTMIMTSMVGTWAAMDGGGRCGEGFQISINEGLQTANRQMTTRPRRTADWSNAVGYCNWAGARAPLPGARTASPSPVCAMGAARAARWV